MSNTKIREALELSRKVGVKMEWDDVRDRCEEALAELDKAQQPGKVLTDEEIERIGNLYDDHTKTQAWAFARGEAYRMALRYARDSGYLAPAAGMTDERPWMNEWQRNMCKKSKASLINIIEEERDENDRLRNLAPSAGLTVEETEQIMETFATWQEDMIRRKDLEKEERIATLRARLNEKLKTKNQ